MSCSSLDAAALADVCDSEQVDDASVYCRYLFDKDVFEISCPLSHGTRSYEIFAGLCILVEVDFDHCTPMNEIQIHEESDETDWHHADTHDQPQTAPVPLLIDTGVNDDTAEENVTLWSPSDPLTNLANVFTIHVLEQISFDTGCAATLDRERKAITLRKTAVSFAQKAVLKLNQLERNALRVPHVKHVVRTEKAMTTLLVLKPLKHCPGAMIRTLLPCDLDDYHMPSPNHFTDGIPNMHVLKMVDLEATRLRQSIPPVASSSVSIGQAWKAISLPALKQLSTADSALDTNTTSHPAHDNSIDSEEGLPMATKIPRKRSRFDVPPAAHLPPQNPITRWMEGLPQDVPIEVCNTLVTLSGSRIDNFPPQVSDQRDTITEHGATDASSSIHHLNTDSRSQDGLSRMSESRYESTPLRYEQTIFHQHDWESKTVKADATGVLVDVDVAGASMCLSPFPQLGDPYPAPRTIFVAPLMETGDLISFDMEQDAQIAPLHETSSNVTVVSPLRQKAATLEADHPDLQWAESSPQPPRSSSPIVIERLKLDDEPREYRTTFRQRAPMKGRKSNKAGAFKAVLELPDPVPTRAPLSRSISRPASTSGPDASDEAAYKILPALQQARSFRGDVRVAIQFGQILLHNFKNGDARNFAKATYNSVNFESGLESQHEARHVEVLFNLRLTTSLPEICQTLEGFIEQPETSSSCYEFLVTLEGKQLCVLVSEASVQVRAMPELLGCVFFHYPRRFHDTRCLIQGWEETSEELKDFTDAIKTGLTEGKSISLSWTIARKGLTINSVYAKRTVSYGGLASDELSLEVTEVQHLLVRRNGNDYVAYVEPDMPRKQRVWFETAMVVKQNPLLSQNHHLQLGDDAEWGSKDILSDEMLRSMMLMSDRVITRMDGIGASNQGPRGSPEDVEMIERNDHERKLEMQGVSHPFW